MAEAPDAASRPAIPPFDRRVYPRSRATRPAKLFHRAGLTFAPAQTVDLSEGGALLTVHAARRFEPGDVVDVVVEPKTEPGVVRTRSLIEATILRSAPKGDEHQFVAVRFARTRGEFGPERVAA